MLVLTELLIPLLILGVLVSIIVFVLTRDKKSNSKGSNESLDEYIGRLKSLLKEAEDNAQRGMSDAEEKAVFYKEQLNKVTKLKDKTKDL